MTKNWQSVSMTWGKRLLVTVAVLGGLLYGMLAMAQRSPNSLRLGMEDYLTRATGQRGEITDLKEVRLVPDAYFDMNGVYIRDRKNPETVYLAAKTARVSMPLMGMLGGGGSYYKLEVEKLDTASGFFLPQKLNLSFLGISDPDQSAPPQLMADGTYNNLPLLLTMEMRRKMKRGKPLYSTPDQSMVTFKLGETEGEGLLKRGILDVSLQSARLERDGMEALFTAENLHKSPLQVKIDGTIEGAKFNAVLTREGDNIVLRVTPAADNAEDIHKIQRFVDLISGDLGLTGEENIRMEVSSPPTQSKGSE